MCLFDVWNKKKQREKKDQSLRKEAVLLNILPCGRQFSLVIVFSHAGDEDDVFGSVLQSCQFGDLVELLIAHFSMWKNV